MRSRFEGSWKLQETNWEGTAWSVRLLSARDETTSLGSGSRPLSTDAWHQCSQSTSLVVYTIPGLGGGFHELTKTANRTRHAGLLSLPRIAAMSISTDPDV